uniref:Eclosion hormone n=1 Tax=Megaselia scalaris TaxID=36166 RepID=T1GKL2_MEGSC
MCSKLIVLAFLCVSVLAANAAQPYTYTMNSPSKPYTYTYTKRFDSMSGLDFITICLNNCMQCKEIFGEIFLGQKCEEACMKFRGRAVPDCENYNSIAPFIKVA